MSTCLGKHGRDECKCTITQEKFEKDLALSGMALLTAKCPNTHCKHPYGMHLSSSSYKSPPAPAAPPLPRKAPSAHLAVINGSGLTKEEKDELIGLCSEELNWANAEAIGAIPSSSALDDTLRGQLAYLRKKYSTPVEKGPPSSHVPVIDASDLAMEEKYELKYFCAEQVNWAQAQRIGQMAVTSGLAEELRNLLGFFRKKYQDQLAAAVASASASASKSKNQKLEHMKSRMIDRNLQFHNELLSAIDRCRCDICETIGNGDSELEDSFIIPVSFRDIIRQGFICDKLDISSPYYHNNGLLLCKVCDGFFERHEIGIDGSGTISCASLLKHEDKATRKKYKELHGTKVRWADEIGSGLWPSRKLLEFRNTLPTENRNVKDEKAEKEAEERASKDEMEEYMMDVEQKQLEDLLEKKEVIAGLKNIVSEMRKLKWLEIRRRRMRIHEIEKVEELGRTTLSQLIPPLAEYDVLPDGNCTFRAILDQMIFHGIIDYDGFPRDHNDLRELFRTYCRSNMSALNSLGIGTNLIDNFGDGQWENELGDLVVFILARAFDLNVRVVHGTQLHEFHYGAGGGPVLTLVYNGIHYQSTRLAPAAPPSKKQRNK